MFPTNSINTSKIVGYKDSLPTLTPLDQSETLTPSKLSGLSAPISSTFSLSYDQDTILVVSHPGWSKRYTLEQSNIARTLSESSSINEARKKCVCVDVFDQLIAPKLAALVDGYGALLFQELAAEEAIARGAKIGLPLILTIPVELNNHSLVVAGDKTHIYTEYINAVIKHVALDVDGKPVKSIWLLPTNSKSGTVIGAPDAEVDPHGLHTFSSLNAPTVGNYILPLIECNARQIIFAGGFLDGCLLSTISYFLPHGCQDFSELFEKINTRKLLIDDRFTTSQSKSVLTSDGEIKYVQRANFSLSENQMLNIEELLLGWAEGKISASIARSGILHALNKHLPCDTTNHWNVFAQWEDRLVARHNPCLNYELLSMLPPLVHPDGIILGKL
jgi:hypothetical protein